MAGRRAKGTANLWASHHPLRSFIQHNSGRRLVHASIQAEPSAEARNFFGIPFAKSSVQRFYLKQISNWMIEHGMVDLSEAFLAI
jgi:hypothetical protein